MGGGKKSFDGSSPQTAKDVADKQICVRSDGRNLTREWIRDKESRQLPYEYLENADDLNSLDTENTKYILGRRLLLFHARFRFTGPVEILLVRPAN